MFARRIAALFLYFCISTVLYVLNFCNDPIGIAVGRIWAGIAKRNKKRLRASDVPRCVFLWDYQTLLNGYACLDLQERNYQGADLI